MLVVTANWAVGDGTLVPAVAPWHAAIPTAIHRGILRAGVRHAGDYEPVERVDVVLAGDTFDWLLSAEWQGGVKPWHGDAAAEAMRRVAARSIRHARRLLRPILRWARHGIAVPAAARGRPGRRLIRVPVHVTLLCGDRDAAAERIVGRRRERQPVVVGRAWDDGRVSVRHGDEFDPACRTAGGSPPGRHREPTLAESIRVDLVGRFAAEAAGTAPAAARLARGLAAAGTDALASVLAAWARSSAGAAGPRPHGVDDAWRRCVNAWWRGARTVVPSSACEFDVVDALAAELDRGLGGDVPPSAPLLDGLRARPPRGSSGLVLGHPRHPGGGTLAICLGAGAVAGPPGPPPLLACPATAGWPRWQRLLPEDERSAVVAIGAARPVAADGGAVVDAA